MQQNEVTYFDSTNGIVAGMFTIRIRLPQSVTLKGIAALIALWPGGIALLTITLYS